MLENIFAVKVHMALRKILLFIYTVRIIKVLFAEVALCFNTLKNFDFKTCVAFLLFQKLFAKVALRFNVAKKIRVH